MSTRYGAARDAGTLARRRRAYVALRTHYGAHTAEAAQALGIAPVTARRYEQAARAAGHLPAPEQAPPRTRPRPGPWVASAACARSEYDPQWWTPEEPAGSTARQSAEARALQVCRQVCPVIRECLRHAHAAPEITGIWGGTTPIERALALQEEAAPVRTGAA